MRYAEPAELESPRSLRLCALRDALKEVMPDPLRRAGSWAVWRGSAHLKRADHALTKLYNQYAGRRLFLLGNGPSLAEMDLGRLTGEVTLGTNRIYLHPTFRPTLYACVNELVLRQCHEQIEALDMPRFVSWPGRRLVPGAVPLRCHRREPLGFSDDPRQGVWIGGTVTYFALQIAFFLGFQEVVLLGIDHRFETQGEPNAEVTSEGDDPNHFVPGYFGKGFRWQLPDLAMSERAYRLADERFRAAGRRIVNATPGTALEVFPRIDFDEVLKQR